MPTATANDAALGDVKSKIYDKWMAKLGRAPIEGKAIAITGCTTGIGRVVALAAAKHGAGHIFLLNRPSERAQEVEAAIRAAASGDAHVATIACDLQSFASVRRAATELWRACKRIDGGLDVLYCNAGVMSLPEKATEDGYDVQMQTNHLSHFILTSALIPQLERAANGPRGEARVVVISSSARQGGGFLEAKFLNKFEGPGTLGGDKSDGVADGTWLRYHHSKLANVLFVLALHKWLQQRGSKVKALGGEPGFAATELQSTSIKGGGMTSGQGRLVRTVSQSAEDGALCTIWPCFAPDAVSGSFYAPFWVLYGAPSATIVAGKATGWLTRTTEKNALHEPSQGLLWERSEAAMGHEFGHVWIKD